MRIVDNMRDSYCREISRFAMMPVRKAIAYAVKQSDSTQVVLVDDKPLLMFGVIVEESVLQNRNRPWMIADRDAVKHKKSLLKEGRRLLLQLVERYGILENNVAADNEEAIRWLEYMGFIVDGSVYTSGVSGIQYRKYLLKG